jgi:hypothetical protein
VADVVSSSARPPPSLNGADWASSDAKRLICQDMLDGLVPIDEKIHDVERLYNELYAHQPEFRDFPFDRTRYADRIGRLQTVVKRMKWAAQYDQECFNDFRLKFPQQSHGPTGKPLWKDSEADRCLKEDMTNGLHLQMKPGKLFETRDCYQPFGKHRFSKGINQLTEAAKPYGTNPMQAAAKKAKKDKTKVKNCPEISRLGNIDAYHNH